jgi:hypothetical protein
VHLRSALIALAAAALALGGGLLAGQVTRGIDTRALAATTAASCDSDGVNVAYDVEYSAGSIAGYKVETVRVSGIASDCVGAALSVELKDGQTVVGRGGPVAVANDAMAVPVSPPVLAEDFVGVRVVIEGPQTTTPIPARCAGMTLDAPVIGTAEADTLVGTNLRELIIGFAQDDVIRAAGGADCVAGQNGDDSISAGGGSDVVLAGPGDDRLQGGPGRDLLRGGTGRDRCAGGPGRDRLVGCEMERP